MANIEQVQFIKTGKDRQLRIRIGLMFLIRFLLVYRKRDVVHLRDVGYIILSISEMDYITRSILKLDYI
jgi:hypothetical protein